MAFLMFLLGCIAGTFLGVILTSLLVVSSNR